MTANLIAEKITAETESQFQLTYETEECDRCCATGYHGPVSVNSGKCFQCHGAAKVRTRAGQKAYAAGEKLRDELMGTEAAELEEGDVVFLDGRWRRLAGAKVRECRTRKVTIGDRVTEYYTQVELTYGRNAQAGCIVHPDMKIWRQTSANRAEYLRRMCTVAGAVVSVKEPTVG